MTGRGPHGNGPCRSGDRWCEVCLGVLFMPVRARKSALLSAAMPATGSPPRNAAVDVPARAARTRNSGNGANGAEMAALDLRKLLRALQSVRDGDFSVRLASDQTGLAGKIADTFNEIVTANERLAHELERAGRIVGKDGMTRH